MAQLELVEQNGVTLPPNLLEAFGKLSDKVFTEKNVRITIRTKPAGGYISTYRLVEDLAKSVILDDRVTSSDVSDLIRKAQDPAEFITICNNQEQFTQLQNALESLDKRQFNVVYPESIWQFRKFRVKSTHPYLQGGQILYGIPNKPSVDPRRSGQVIWLDKISGDVYAYLREISHEYGFYWYGLDPTFWYYQPQSISDKIKAILQLGLLGIVSSVFSAYTEGITAVYNFFTGSSDEEKAALTETWDKLFEEIFD
jgi:hypothetical protein